MAKGKREQTKTAALQGRWRKTEAYVLRDAVRFTRAVVVRGAYGSDYEWFAGKDDGLCGTLLKARNAAIEAIATEDKRSAHASD